MSKTLLGVIEGFYGRPYQDDCRLDLCSFLKEQGLHFYIYAPKNASFLRRTWTEPLSSDEISQQKILSEHCRSCNLKYGFGISPLNICKDVAKLLPKLLDKTCHLVKETKAPLVALLFDDIKIAKNEGQIQNYIIKEMAKALPSCVEKLLVCPSYYSEDPILEKVFGSRPQSYFEELTDNIPSLISFFYTGPKVLSPNITPCDIKKAKAYLGEHLSIWDNYPVNDGKNICNKIYTAPFSGRTELDGSVELHAINPMTECHLSKMAIASLASIYSKEESALALKRKERILEELFLDKVADLKPYLQLLQNQGLQALSALDKEKLMSILKTLPTAGACELKLFLEGFYKFDPTCLTS